MLEMDLYLSFDVVFFPTLVKTSPPKHGTRDKVPYTNFKYILVLMSYCMLAYTNHVLQVEAAAKSGPDHESVPLFAWIRVPKLNLHYQKTNMAGWKIPIIQYPAVNDHISSHQKGKPENHGLESAGWDGIC